MEKFDPNTKRWEAIDKEGRYISEDDINWELVKDKVEYLQFYNKGQIIYLPSGMEYVQGKTASALLGSGEIKIESRFVGVKLGNNIIKVRIDEKTNNISIEIENESNNAYNSKRNENSD